MPQLFVYLPRQWQAQDGSQRLLTAVVLQEGIYEVEEIPNPRGGDHPWTVLEGTKVGGPSWPEWSVFSFGRWRLERIEQRRMSREDVQ